MQYRACTKFLWKISYNDTVISDNPRANSKTNEFRGEFKAQIFLKKFEEYQKEIEQAFELLNEKEEIDSQISKISKFIFELIKSNVLIF